MGARQEEGCAGADRGFRSTKTTRMFSGGTLRKSCQPQQVLDVGRINEDV